jgi:hypothetical protein
MGYQGENDFSLLCSSWYLWTEWRTMVFSHFLQYTPLHPVLSHSLLAGQDMASKAGWEARKEAWGLGTVFVFVKGKAVRKEGGRQARW